MDMSGQISYHEQLQETQPDKMGAGSSITPKVHTEKKSHEVKHRPKDMHNYRLNRSQKQNDSFRGLCTWVLENQIGT